MNRAQRTAYVEAIKSLDFGDIDLSGVTSRGDGSSCIHGPARTLARICARLGFKNDCRKGSVFLTTPKFRAVMDAIEKQRVARTEALT